MGKRTEYHKKWRAELIELEKIDPKHPRVVAFRSHLPKWREKNKAKIAAKHKEEYDKNPKKFREQSRASAKKNRAKNRKKIWARLKLKMDTDPEFKLQQLLRQKLNKELKRAVTSRSKKTKELLGCTIKEFRAYLEARFQPGMTWGNHGIHGWHMDHIKPCSSFNLTLADHQAACFHYTNIQPLWARDNIIKSNKLISFPEQKPTPSQLVAQEISASGAI